MPHLNPTSCLGFRQGTIVPASTPQTAPDHARMPAQAAKQRIFLCGHGCGVGALDCGLCVCVWACGRVGVWACGRVWARACVWLMAAM